MKCCGQRVCQRCIGRHLVNDTKCFFCNAVCADMIEIDADSRENSGEGGEARVEGTGGGSAPTNGRTGSEAAAPASVGEEGGGAEGTVVPADGGAGAAPEGES